MSSISTVNSPTKSPIKIVKTRYDALGFLFGSVLESFDDLLPLKKCSDSSIPGTSLDLSDSKIIKPTKQHIVRQWMYEFDKEREASPKKLFNTSDKTSVVWKVTENLINFWKDHHKSEELRYVFIIWDTLGAKVFMVIFSIFEIFDHELVLWSLEWQIQEFYFSSFSIYALLEENENLSLSFIYATRI